MAPTQSKMLQTEADQHLLQKKGHILRSLIQSFLLYLFNFIRVLDVPQSFSLISLCFKSQYVRRI